MADYRQCNHTLDSIVEYHSMDFLLLGEDSAQRVQTGVVSANCFDVLGVTPLLGRTFVASDESPNADAVLVLSYKYWRNELGGDANIIARIFQMNNRPHRVIGVLPSIPEYPAENDVALHDVDPQLAVDQIDTIERLQHESVASPRVTATLLGMFAALALAHKPVADQSITVAFVLARGATVIDFSGPWEVFQDVMVYPDGRPFQFNPSDKNFRQSMNNMRMPFALYTVAEKKELVRASGGLQVMPDYTFADAPKPDIVIVPAESRESEARKRWLIKVKGENATVASVCTGAYILAGAGLLDGASATTHHAFQDDFQQKYPKVKVQHGVRYVQATDHIITAGGLTSGIDMALHLVEMYFGAEVAKSTAEFMEFSGGSQSAR
jgi:putative intracellular protease/amidase